jgi:hypothetical protein
MFLKLLDLELAAELGQQLLFDNKELERRKYELEDKCNQMTSKVDEWERSKFQVKISKKSEIF